MASSKGTATITYEKPGTQPPIYVAGTFSNPPWIAHEMDYTVDSDGEHTFVKEVTGEPGSKIQYKFRIGDGDWWVLHESLPTVEDSAGNLNHELELQDPDTQAEKLFSGESQRIPRSPDYDNPISPKTVFASYSRPNPDRKIPEGLAKRLVASNSGTSTPTYAKVAAEVADSAALIDKEKPETPIPDDLAGKIGYRRLTSTPIAEVANTAAEVADTAQDLDSVEPTVELRDILGIENSRRDDNSLDSEETGRHRASLFSHEAIGMFDGDEDLQEYTVPPEPHPENSALEGTEADLEADLDDIDMNDPTLERFPSNRDEIIEAVRKISTSLGEDQLVFDGVPPAPFVAQGRRGTGDESADLLAPVPVSPVVPHPLGRLSNPISSSHSSVASLQAIAEAEEPSAADDTKISPVVLVSTPQERPAFRPTSSDEDEGVVIQDYLAPKTLNRDLPIPEVDVSPRAGPQRVTSEPPLEPLDRINKSLQMSDDGDEASSSHSFERANVEDSHGADKTTAVIDGDTEDRSNGRAHVDGQTSATGLDTGAGDPSQLRMRGGAGNEQVGTPSSGPPPIKHEDGWLKAFFRVLFVDWIGGLIKLCGGKRKT